MDCLGCQFLPSSAFPIYQNGRVGLRNARYELVDLLHGRGFTYHVVFEIQVRTKPFRFLFQPFKVFAIFERDSGNP